MKKTLFQYIYELEVRSQKSRQLYPVTQKTIRLGIEGKKEVDLYLNEEKASNRQAIVRVIQKQVFFNNLNPALPAYKDGQSLTYTQLKAGECITLGDTTLRINHLGGSPGLLLALEGPLQGEFYWLDPHTSTIGKEPSHTIWNPYQEQEGTPFKILSHKNNLWLLPDQESSLTLNNLEVQKPTVLSQGSILKTQDHRFRLVLTQKKTLKQPRREQQKEESTILFTNIWDKKQSTSHYMSGEFLGQLDQLYRAFCEVIVAHQGEPMTYLGDCMVSVFRPSTESDKNCAYRALISAVKVQQKLLQLNQRWSRKHLPPLNIGIGLATDMATTGDVGHSGQLELAVMGKITHLANNISKLTQRCEVPLLFCQKTATQLEEHLVHQVGSFTFRGFPESQPISTLKKFLAKKKKSVT